MEGLLSTGPTSSSFFKVIISCRIMGKIPFIGQQVAFVQDYIILLKTGVCHLCYHTIEGDHKVNNKEIYFILIFFIMACYIIIFVINIILVVIIVVGQIVLLLASRPRPFSCLGGAGAPGSR